ncbi:hypothetical protein [Streptomyces gobiensis]|uniref:hypothetical protein n=1 Tax=Streptomyces gobiensis TaxID=2875706 RepID=UPI001E41D0BC|nr:hypothetical protein [Streptomyces gobiensis]UGY92686.1 hypothetical protein test1122_13785 [Streptomyces gobiensis]
MRPALLVCGAALAALALTGCAGSSDGAAEPSASPSETVSAEETAYYRCLEKNGLVLETPNPGQLRVDKDKNTDEAAATAAEETCRDFLKAIPDPPVSEERLAAARKVSACVREKGYEDYPDPDPKTGEVDLEAAGVAEDPELRAALQDCRPTGTGVGDAVVGG